MVTSTNYHHLLSRSLYFIGLNTASADQSPLNGAVQRNFDALQIGKDHAEAFADDFRTGAAFFLFHTASSIFSTGCRAFGTDDTRSHEYTSDNSCHSRMLLSGILLKIRTLNILEIIGLSSTM